MLHSHTCNICIRIYYASRTTVIIVTKAKASGDIYENDRVVYRLVRFPWFSDRYSKTPPSRRGFRFNQFGGGGRAGLERGTFQKLNARLVFVCVFQCVSTVVGKVALDTRAPRNTTKQFRRIQHCNGDYTNRQTRQTDTVYRCRRLMDENITHYFEFNLPYGRHTTVRLPK